MSGALHIGLREPDVAALTQSGTYYKMYVYIDDESGNVMATLFAELEHGQDILLKTYEVYDGNVGTIQSARVIAGDTAFSVMFTDSSSGNLIRKFVLSVVTLDTTGFVGGGTLAVHADMLYDAHYLGTSNSVVMAYKSAAAAVVVIRLDSMANFTAAWSQPFGDNPINCLGVFGDVTMDLVVVGYQPSGTTVLRYGYLDTSGSAETTADVFGTGAHLDTSDYTAVGFANLDGDNVAIVCEGRDQAQLDSGALYAERNRFIAYRRITSAGAKAGNDHWCFNLTLVSKPWAYAGAAVNGATPRVYCAVGFKSELSPNNQTNSWQQSYYFVVDLDQQEWGSGSGAVRPLPCATMNLGTADARVIALKSATLGDADGLTRQYNHLSSFAAPPAVGPDVKSRTFAVITWGRLTTFDPASTIATIDTQPITSRVAGYKFHMEEPWMTHRDDSDPGLPSVSYKFPYPWAQNLPIEVGRNTFFGGGTPKVYDGELLVEVGFCWYPDLVKTTQSVSSPGIAEGVYNYTAIYEWRDSKGQLHRSSPSIPVEEENDSGALRRVTVRVRTINLSMKENHRHVRAPKIDIVLYRTKAGGSIFYRCFGNDGWSVGSGGTVDETPANDPTVPWIDIIDNNSDADIEDNDILSWQFVNGLWAPLVPIQPPALPVVAKWRNRAWGAGGEEPGVIWYSIEMLPEPGGTALTAPEFNSANTYRLDSGAEQVTAMHPMDSVLVVFTDRNIYILTGDGTDAAGFGSTLDHQLVVEGTGCIDPRSVARIPDGVMFQSMKGIYILTRTFELRYIGSPVEDVVRNAGNIHAATVMEDRNQVRFILNEAPSASQRVLIYDYLFDQWSRIVFDDDIVATANLSTYTDGLDWRGRNGETVHVILAGQGLLIERADDANAFIDSDQGGTAAVFMDVRTGWVNLEQIADFKRLRSVLVTLSKPQSTAVTIDIDYEIDGTFDAAQTDTFTSASPAKKTIRIRPRIQKCTAIRLRVYETGAIALTENIKIHAVTLEIASKRGHLKVPDANVAT